MDSRKKIPATQALGIAKSNKYGFSHALLILALCPYTQTNRNRTHMNILVTLLQILLGLWNITGGIYMSTHHQELINEWAAGTFPAAFWVALGVIQIVLSVGLILSVGKGKLRKLATLSAIGLAIIALFGIPSYSAYAGFPGLLWGVIPAVLLLFVAYWRGGR